MTKTVQPGAGRRARGGPKAGHPPPRVWRQLAAPLAYEPVWRRMQAHTAAAMPGDPDQIWLLHHQPVFTQGSNGRAEHVLDPGAIPVVASDRGGQVTYHGPGQIMAYVLLDLHRLGLGVRSLVSALETAMIRSLAVYGIEGRARRDAPGVYVPALGMAKIGAVGLRIRRGRCYHGLALNVDVDLQPFGCINPCGYSALAVTSIADLLAGAPPPLSTVSEDLLACLCQSLGYRHSPDRSGYARLGAPGDERGQFPKPASRVE